MQISILLMEQIFELFLTILMGFIIVTQGMIRDTVRFWIKPYCLLP